MGLCVFGLGELLLLVLLCFSGLCVAGWAAWRPHCSSCPGWQPAAAAHAMRRVAFWSLLLLLLLKMKAWLLTLSWTSRSHAACLTNLGELRLVALLVIDLVSSHMLLALAI